MNRLNINSCNVIKIRSFNIFLTNFHYKPIEAINNIIVREVITIWNMYGVSLTLISIIIYTTIT